MINNAVLLSVVQKSDSVAHTLVSILFQNLFPFRLLHNIEQSSLHSTVCPCWLSILSIVVCTSEKGMATHSIILAWRIPWREEPGGRQSIGLHRVGHD